MAAEAVERLPVRTYQGVFGDFPEASLRIAHLLNAFGGLEGVVTALICADFGAGVPDDGTCSPVDANALEIGAAGDDDDRIRLGRLLGLRRTDRPAIGDFSPIGYRQTHQA